MLSSGLILSGCRLRSQYPEVYQMVGERRMPLPVDLEVVPPPPDMVGPVDDQALRIHRELRLHGVPLLLTRVVSLPLLAIFWTWYLLFRRVDERPEAREVSLYLLDCPGSPYHLVKLLWQRDALLDEGLEHSYVLQDVALVEAESESQQYGRHIGPVVHEEHKEPVLRSEEHTSELQS